MQDRTRPGCPSTVDSSQIIALVDANPYLTIREVRSVLGVSLSSISTHLKDAGYVNRASIWVPHSLTDSPLRHRMDVCDLFIEKKKSIRF